MPDALVISHRTNMGASPENSLEGIAAALAEGVDGIEIDVRASRDGVPMLLHDATLERTHGDGRALAALTALEARALGVASLEEALAATTGRAVLYIEVKERGLGAAVARVVLDANAASRCWIWAFDPEAGRECRAAFLEAGAEVPVAVDVSPGSPASFGYDSAIEECVRSGFTAVSLDHRLVNPEVVSEAHARGLLVFTWTVDEPPEIERVLEAGVDGVCGNFPPRIRAVIQARRATA